MATDYKATVSKGNEMNILNKLKEGEFACADAYYLYEVLIMRWSLEEENYCYTYIILFNELLPFSHCQINMNIFLFIMKKNESLKY